VEQYNEARLPADDSGGACARIIDFTSSPDVADGDGDQHRQAAEAALIKAYAQPSDPLMIAAVEALLAIGCELRGLRDGEISDARARADQEAEAQELPLRRAWFDQQVGGQR
jgi:hypothetical protein